MRRSTYDTEAHAASQAETARLATERQQPILRFSVDGKYCDPPYGFFGFTGAVPAGVAETLQGLVKDWVAEGLILSDRTTPGECWACGECIPYICPSCGIPEREGKKSPLRIVEIIGELEELRLEIRRREAREAGG